MSRLRTTLAVAAGLLLTGVAPALATISSPADGSIVTEGPVLRGTIDIGATASGVNLTVTGSDASATAGGPCGSDGVTCSGRVVTFEVPVTLPVNGTYTLQAVGYHTASSSLDRASSKTETSTFGLELAPAAPRRLTAQPDGGDRTVALTWAANTEPDLVGYQVVRSVDGGPTEARANVASGTTRYVDDAEPGGRLTYQVLAVRRGATASRVVAGPLSATATATIDTPPTTTTTSTTEAPSTTETTAGTTTGPTTPPSGGTTATSAGGLRPTAAAAPVRITPGKSLDMSGFRPSTAPPSFGPAPAPTDTGYEETLPYEAPDPEVTEELGDDPVVGTEAALPVGTTVTETTSTNREALLSFLAGAMVLFVLSMHVRWLLRRATPVA